ncbi:deoxyribonuclease IV [Candidatus Babeliales bacterium]|nr:deoxyribonuclease IV [Candidatus Babeliales bacterium]
MKKNNPLIGAHVSINGGFYKAIEQAQAITANCIQIFTKSNRQWKARTITEKEAETFHAMQKKFNIKVIAHASYLINLGSISLITQTKSIHALTEEIQRCSILNIAYLVLHPGTYDKTQPFTHGAKIIAHNLDQAITKSKTKNVTILLETMAGQGSVAGSTFEELATILKQIKHKKQVGVCVDTAHIFAAGYQFDTPTNYKKMWVLFKKHIGIKKLKAMHINDSKTSCGSRVDRHEHIGHGKIPDQAFKLIMQDPALHNVIKVIETPKEDNQTQTDKKNIAQLKLFAKKNR